MKARAYFDQSQSTHCATHLLSMNVSFKHHKCCTCSLPKRIYDVIQKLGHMTTSLRMTDENFMTNYQFRHILIDKLTHVTSFCPPLA